MAQRASGQQQGVGFFGWLKRLLLLLIMVAAGGAGWWYYQMQRETEILNGIIDRLTAVSRVAEVRVEEIGPDESGGKPSLKLKFVEYDPKGGELDPIECTFSVNNVIHFEALVVRLSDEIIKGGEGKSIHLFRRAYALDDGGNTYESCELNKPMEVPGGYRLETNDKRATEIERGYWKAFWELALDDKRREAAGVRNAQIEAPATRFQADKLYRLKLEADGGLIIDAGPVPKVHQTKPVIQPPKGQEGTP